MTFIPPALASPMPSALPADLFWIAEQKYDGHRLIVCVGPTGGVTAWSRSAKERRLPPHLAAAFSELPCGTYDGELMAAGETAHSYNVTDLSCAAGLHFIAFDILVLDGELLFQQSPTSPGLTYVDRREILAKAVPADPFNIRLSWSHPVGDIGEAMDLACEIWKLNGEGLILKAASSTYIPGKRLKTWLKIKAEQTAVMSLIGFSVGAMGPFSVAVLADDSGHTVPVKWKDHAWLEERAARGRADIGRRVRIAFQERTPDGAYRHPRWDRWEDE
jgi:bifunctional non-homologous end joining protein LigD